MAKIQSAAKYRQLNAISLSAGANWRSTGRLPLGKAPRQPAHMVRDFADRSYCVIFLDLGDPFIFEMPHDARESVRAFGVKVRGGFVEYEGQIGRAHV